MKTCNHCKVTKTLDQFVKNRRQKDGLEPRCKECNKEIKIRWYLKNRTRLLAYSRSDEGHAKKRQYRLSSPNRKYAEYRTDAKRRNFVFEISLEVFSRLFYSQCHYCHTDKAHGVDRLNSSEGYIDANVVSCCWTCNRMKNVLSHDVFIMQCLKIAGKHGYIKFEDLLPPAIKDN